jgi:hypothetical protein
LAEVIKGERFDQGDIIVIMCLDVGSNYYPIGKANGWGIKRVK